MRRCLNIGCGQKAKASTEDEHWVNLDAISYEGVDVVRDLRRGLPFDDGSFDFCLADNVLEHFASEDVIFLINELDRVLLIGGTAEVIVPSALSQGAYQDPTHRSFFVPRSALYWSPFYTIYGGPAVGITARLAIEETKIHGDPETEEFITWKLQKK